MGNRTSQRRTLIGVVTLGLILSSGSASGQPPLIQPNGIRGAIIIQRNGQDRVFQFGQPGVFRTPVVPQQTSEPPVYPEAPPLPSRPPLDERKLDQLIFQLSSDSFRERAEATKELKGGGIETVHRLAEVLRSDSPEAARRALSILEELFLSEDELASLAAEDALVELAESEKSEKSPRAARAEEFLRDYSLIRTIRATRELIVLGAHIEYRDDIFEVDDHTGELIPRIGLVRFDHKWKGGVQGLKLLSRIDGIGVGVSPIYYVLNCPVSREDFLTAIRTWAPRIDPGKINIRSEAQLGIRFDVGLNPPASGVLVSDAPQGFAAAEAGILPGDLLTEINKIPLKHATDLTTELENYRPGDEVEITLKRPVGTEADPEMELKVVTVTLKGWTDEDSSAKSPQSKRAGAAPKDPSQRQD